MFFALRNILNRSVYTNSIRIEDVRHFKKSSVSYAFWEKDEKGGYIDKRKLPSKTQMIREGLKELKQEIALWSQEVKEHFEFDPYMAFRPGETDIIWQFNNKKTLNDWVVTCDSDHNEGYSKCSLDLNKYGKGLFSGELCTQVPKDGRIKRAGYCNMKTTRARKSFKRDSYLDWSPYNMLVMKVRGDGRSYLLNISTKGFFDLMWNDTFHYVLYTRGGPYWQISKLSFRLQVRGEFTGFSFAVCTSLIDSLTEIKTAMIPFSKFFFASKGRVQDRQCPIPLNRVTNFGISMGDKINGSFSLEMDYIGVEYNPNHTEEFAYEMYKMPKYIVAT